MKRFPGGAASYRLAYLASSRASLDLFKGNCRGAAKAMRSARKHLARANRAWRNTRRRPETTAFMRSQALQAVRDTEATFGRMCGRPLTKVGQGMARRLFGGR